jgi:NTP pyrophosphatase (non-canonical NTP hydrolase)
MIRLEGFPSIPSSKEPIMATVRRVIPLQDQKSLAWFEQAVLDQMPQVGILDGASLGCLGIAESAGRLAGEWKRHRILMHDLDTEQVTATLGELLAAVVQMAHAAGVSLESLAEGQIQRMRMAPERGVRQRKARSTATPMIAPAGEQASVTTRPARRHTRDVPVEQPELTCATPRRRRSSKATALKELPASEMPARTPRRRSAASPPAKEHAVPPSRRQRRAVASVPIQPTLLADESVRQSRRKPASRSRSASHP